VGHHRRQHDNHFGAVFETVTPVEWAGFGVAITTLISSGMLSVRWLVKHYLNELKPNGGSSVKDSINRLEARIDEIYRLIAQK
jgi:hypothetical protein